MLKKYWSALNLNYERTLLYMLQQVEYDIPQYLKWLHRVKDFRTVTKRGHVVPTLKVKVLFGCLALFVLAYAGLVFWAAITINTVLAYFLAIMAMLLLPCLAPFILLAPLVIGRYVVQKPLEWNTIRMAKKYVKGHRGYKIAIAGSYGKTTAKEVLRAVLSGGRKVAATPGNTNQPLGLARFIMGTRGDEDILIFELGEYRPGDITEMCEFIDPDAGFITGINDAHLESFGSIEYIIDDIFSLKNYLKNQPLYMNGDNELLAGKDTKHITLYSERGTENNVVQNVKVGAFGTTFSLGKFEVTSGLLGWHNIGIVSAAVELAQRMGLTDSEIRAGLAKLQPFEHRMQPYDLNGATIIDDTYNGNLDGVKAGLRLLSELPAKRKVYVTPGLVEQGDKAEANHREIGRLLIGKVDKVVLMRNSVTGYIADALARGGFTGKLTMINDPLDFYENLDKFVAAGDLVLMQNDWTDNYA
jgi:UDP-N-acetylmuramoyl-tripeptide--D-alanyl-D-alanine ligase